jgi:hypothetical protein
VLLRIDELAHLMAMGPAFAATVAQLTLVLAMVVLVGFRFEYLTLYRLELDLEVVSGRSTLKSWTLPLSEVEAIVPGWDRPWWRADRNRYVVKLADGRRLFIWSGKGLDQFLECIGGAEPRLRLSAHDRANRAERARGKSGFRGRLPSSEADGVRDNAMLV